MKNETVLFIGICFFILTFTNLADSQPSVDEQVMLCGSMHIVYLGGGASAKGAFATTMVMAI